MYRSNDEKAKFKHFFSTYDWQWINRDERKWWREFCFHYTDLPNIPKILKQDCLCSRNCLQSYATNWHDVASREIINHTDEYTKDSVRFYFRPRTPTQFQIEGIKSKKVLSESNFPAHCPIPVFMLFDIVDVLSRKDSGFSDGNLASPLSNTYHNPEDLYELPWKKIYHTGYFDTQQNREIIRHRCAEIIIPNRIDLNGLKYIFCRSEAEKETLLYLLQKYPKTFNKYSKIISSSGKYKLFEKRHTFIEKTTLSGENVFIYFSPETRSPGPFYLKVVFSNPEYKKAFEKNITFIKPKFLIKAPVPKVFRDNYIIELFLDDYLVYKNSFRDIFDYSEDIIF